MIHYFMINMLNRIHTLHLSEMSKLHAQITLTFYHVLLHSRSFLRLFSFHEVCWIKKGYQNCFHKDIPHWMPTYEATVHLPEWFVVYVNSTVRVHSHPHGWWISPNIPLATADKNINLQSINKTWFWNQERDVWVIL